MAGPIPDTMWLIVVVEEGVPVDVFLETDRLVLRRFTGADVDELVLLDSGPEVMRFLTGEPTSRAEIEDEVRRADWAAHRSRG